MAARSRSAPDAKKQRILIVGDSTVCATWTGLEVVGQDNGLKVDQGSVFGCGIASGQITTTRNEAITPNSQRCQTMVDTTEREALARTNPTVVIWMSTWEKSDLVVGGKTIVSGTPAGEKEIMSRMDAALERLTLGGAHVVLVTEPAPAPNPAQATATTSAKADDDGYLRLNPLLERFHARHPDNTTLVDLAVEGVSEWSTVSRQHRGLARAPRRASLHTDRGRVGVAVVAATDLPAQAMTTLAADTTEQPTTAAPPRWHHALASSVVFVPALIVAAGGWQHRWMDEDAFINLRIVDQIFAGHGPVFNAGERVEAATSPLWLAVLVVAAGSLRCVRE